MKLSKDLAITACQFMLNIYNGQYGAFVPIEGSSITSYVIDHTQFNYGTWKDYFVLVFQGSMEKADWDDDFNALKKKFTQPLATPYEVKSDIKVHSGFLSQWMSVRQFIWQEFQKSGMKKILITGHSLGAALTTLAAVDFQYNFPYIQELICIPFESPRVGNPAFVKSFNKRVPNTYNFVYLFDIVPRVPPFWMGYKHVSKKINLSPIFYRIFTAIVTPFNFLIGNPFDHYPENCYVGIKNYSRNEFDNKMK